MGHKTMEGQAVEGLSWTTARDKTLEVVTVNPFGFMKFRWKDGGEVPEEISGNYTSFKDIKTAANKYIKTKVEDQVRGVEKVKQKYNAKTAKSQSL
jgi:hypothetical protein